MLYSYILLLCPGDHGPVCEAPVGGGEQAGGEGGGHDGGHHEGGLQLQPGQPPLDVRHLKAPSHPRLLMGNLPFPGSGLTFLRLELYSIISIDTVNPAGGEFFGRLRLLHLSIKITFDF